MRLEIPFEFSLRVFHDQKEGFPTLPLVATSSTQPRDTSCEAYCSRGGSASFSSTKRETLNICLVGKLDIKSDFNEGSYTVRISSFFVPDSCKIYFLFGQLETESLFNYGPLYFSRERFVNSCIYIHTVFCIFPLVSWSREINSTSILEIQLWECGAVRIWFLAAAYFFPLRLSHSSRCLPVITNILTENLLILESSEAGFHFDVEVVSSNGKYWEPIQSEEIDLCDDYKWKFMQNIHKCTYKPIQQILWDLM